MSCVGLCGVGNAAASQPSTCTFNGICDHSNNSSNNNSSSPSPQSLARFLKHEHHHHAKHACLFAPKMMRDVNELKCNVNQSMGSKAKAKLTTGNQTVLPFLLDDQILFVVTIVIDNNGTMLLFLTYVKHAKTVNVPVNVCMCDEWSEWMSGQWSSQCINKWTKRVVSPTRSFVAASWAKHLIT